MMFIDGSGSTREDALSDSLYEPAQMRAREHWGDPRATFGAELAPRSFAWHPTG